MPTSQMAATDRAAPVRADNTSTRPILSILIVTYNSWSVLPRCLDAVAVQTHTRHEIIVVDNGSSDGTPDRLRAAYPHVQVVENGDNRGFAVAMNQAAALAQGNFLVWLNPDTQVLRQGLDQLYAYLRESPGCGLVAPATVDERGRPTSNVLPFYAPGDLLWLELGRGPLRRARAWWRRHALAPQGEMPAGGAVSVEAVIGCAVMVPAAVYARLGGLDERFFMYEEDLDFCLRVHRAGYGVMLLSNAQVMHVGGGSAAGAPQDTLDARTHVTLRRLRARFVYAHKHFGKRMRGVWRVLYGLMGVACLVGSLMPGRQVTRRNLRRRALGWEYLRVARWRLPPSQPGW